MGAGPEQQLQEAFGTNPRGSIAGEGGRRCLREGVLGAPGPGPRQAPPPHSMSTHLPSFFRHCSGYRTESREQDGPEPWPWGGQLTGKDQELREGQSRPSGVTGSSRSSGVSDRVGLDELFLELDGALSGAWAGQEAQMSRRAQRAGAWWPRAGGL